jgi:hypothetical protein
LKVEHGEIIASNRAIVRRRHSSLLDLFCGTPPDPRIGEA